MYLQIQKTPSHPVLFTGTMRFYVIGIFAQVLHISFDIFIICLVHLKMVSNLHAWPLMPRSRIVVFSCCLPPRSPTSYRTLPRTVSADFFFTKLAFQIWIYYLKFGWISKKMKKHKYIYEARKTPSHPVLFTGTMHFA